MCLLGNIRETPKRGPFLTLLMALLKGTLLRGSRSPRVPLILTPSVGCNLQYTRLLIRWCHAFLPLGLSFVYVGLWVSIREFVAAGGAGGATFPLPRSFRV